MTDPALSIVDTSETNVPNRMKIETPIGSIESDSGNHFVDIASVMLIITCVFMFKTIWKKM
tara:strand:+ start:104 stop:286 length:183 start_codon:yes stop_codon:yes gene_type:complete